jgi:hypothetical protein
MHRLPPTPSPLARKSLISTHIVFEKKVPANTVNE